MKVIESRFLQAETPLEALNKSPFFVGAKCEFVSIDVDSHEGNIWKVSAIIEMEEKKP